MCCNLLGISLGNTANFLDLKKKNSAFLYSFTSVRDTTFSRTFKKKILTTELTTVHFDKIAQSEYFIMLQQKCVTVKTDSSAARLVVMATFVLVIGVVGVVICD